jgi:hypothetical protein
MPPHLQLTLLNVPATADSTTSLPRPQHVILNHIYVQRGQVGAFGGVLGCSCGCSWYCSWSAVWGQGSVLLWLHM